MQNNLSFLVNRKIKNNKITKYTKYPLRCKFSSAVRYKPEPPNIARGYPQTITIRHGQIWR